MQEGGHDVESMETEPWQRELREYNMTQLTGEKFKYAPFDHGSDAAMAQFMVEENIGKGQGDRLMKLLRSSIMKEAMNLRDVADMRKRLQTLPGGVRHLFLY
jgi:hypothetical protein